MTTIRTHSSRKALGPRKKICKNHRARHGASVIEIVIARAMTVAAPANAVHSAIADAAAIARARKKRLTRALRK